MESYDVVVVGAGPAGSGAAMAAAKAGSRVLMVEKRQEIGVPKRCGEGFSRTSMKRMGIEHDPVWSRREMIGVTVYSPNGKVVRYDGDDLGWVIDRKVFDKWLAEKATEEGVKVLARTEVTAVTREDGMISGVSLRSQGREWKVKCRILIAADGVESRVSRMAGLNTTLKAVDIISGFQYEMSNIDIDPDRTELYFGNEIAPGGYIWIFPKGKRTANVGIGVRKPFAKKSAKEYLDEWIASRPGLRNGSILEVNSGAVPVGGLMENMVTDNFMAVGDAAHHVNPIHGGGISEAYVGGKIGGEVAAQAIKAGDTSSEFLDRYNKLWWEARGNKLKKVFKLRQVTERLTDGDLNWLAEYLTGEELVEFSKSKGLKRLAKLLIKKPKLAILAKKLL
jgi:digeranylgeranylglycerophospholipid reductase